MEEANGLEILVSCKYNGLTYLVIILLLKIFKFILILKYREMRRVKERKTEFGGSDLITPLFRQGSAS